MEKDNIVIPRDIFFHLRGELAAVVNEKYTHAPNFASGFATTIFRFVPFPLARFNFAPVSSYIFPLFSPGEQSRSKERPKERPRPNRQPHADAAKAVPATVAPACRPKPGARIQQGASLLISCACTGRPRFPVSTCK
jgi:hypothetical protein